MGGQAALKPPHACTLPTLSSAEAVRCQHWNKLPPRKLKPMLSTIPPVLMRHPGRTISPMRRQQPWSHERYEEHPAHRCRLDPNKIIPAAGCNLRRLRCAAEQVLRAKHVPNNAPRPCPLASLKPHCRTSLHASHPRLCSQRREDAQRAKDELNNVLLHDNELKIGWGKTVVLPAMPLYTPNAPTHRPAGAAAARAVASSLDGRVSSRWGEPVQPAPSQPAAGVCGAVSWVGSTTGLVDVHWLLSWLPYPQEVQGRGSCQLPGRGGGSRWEEPVQPAPSQPGAGMKSAKVGSRCGHLCR